MAGAVGGCVKRCTFVVMTVDQRLDVMRVDVRCCGKSRAESMCCHYVGGVVSRVEYKSVDMIRLYVAWVNQNGPLYRKSGYQLINLK